jgi:hypothetical protein
MEINCQSQCGPIKEISKEVKNFVLPLKCGHDKWCLWQRRKVKNPHRTKQGGNLG